MLNPADGKGMLNKKPKSQTLNRKRNIPYLKSATPKPLPAESQKLQSQTCSDRAQYHSIHWEVCLEKLCEFVLVNVKCWVRNQESTQCCLSGMPEVRMRPGPVLPVSLFWLDCQLARSGWLQHPVCRTLASVHPTAWFEVPWKQDMSRLKTLNPF